VKRLLQSLGWTKKSLSEVSEPLCYSNSSSGASNSISLLCRHLNRSNYASCFSVRRSILHGLQTEKKQKRCQKKQNWCELSLVAEVRVRAQRSRSPDVKTVQKMTPISFACNLQERKAAHGSGHGLWLFRPFAVSPPRRFAPGSFAPWLVRPLACSPPGWFAHAPWTIRPWLVCEQSYKRLFVFHTYKQQTFLSLRCSYSYSLLVDIASQIAINPGGESSKVRGRISQGAKEPWGESSRGRNGKGAKKPDTVDTPGVAT